MNIVMTVAVCMLCAIGLVQAAGWLFIALCRPCRARCEEPACHVITLPRTPAELEARLRYELFLLRWCDDARPRRIILLDTGLDDTCHAIVNAMLRGVGGIAICRPEEIGDIVAGS